MDPFGGLGGRLGLRYGRMVSFLRNSFHSILKKIENFQKKVGSSHNELFWAFIGLRYRIKLRFRMNLSPKSHMIP